MSERVSKLGRGSAGQATESVTGTDYWNHIKVAVGSRNEAQGGRRKP